MCGVDWLAMLRRKTDRDTPVLRWPSPPSDAGQGTSRSGKQTAAAAASTLLGVCCKQTTRFSLPACSYGAGDILTVKVWLAACGLTLYCRLLFDSDILAGCRFATTTFSLNTQTSTHWRSLVTTLCFIITAVATFSCITAAGAFC